MKLVTHGLRYLGTKERAGTQDHPLVQWWLELCRLGRDQPDEVPWCSAFLNGLAWEARLPRTHDARARSWLQVGKPVELPDAQPGDVVVLWRGQPDSTQGHVGVYLGHDGARVWLLGGNQSDEVNVTAYPRSRVLGVRRLQ